ncbi:MAG: XRE family transcriptional regulator [Anaerostipes sp.]|uniref:Peptidase S24-like n=1 Tax=Hespellia stercorisuis DSM 15480 TaxID=1121950 RepID=A0A1M6VND4_9FIRM|nr:XRE family transcriptional regulator [Hespellia stercorisuis]MDD3186292.1 XRE family transcriptional regulator [Anaerostipes sp.]MDD3746302.1 XRE family transcriptional regulator [Anaerostipes sp.]SHK82845.1 Peptidase S24-like [Hespellia stercorisuis DSM 15480]
MAQNNNHTIPFPGRGIDKHTSNTVSYNGAQQKQDNVLGTKITEARKSMKLSQKQLSEQLEDYKISVTPGAISKWEKGDSMPNPYQLFALCYCLHISDAINYFTGFSPEASDFTPDLSQKGLNLLQMFKEALVSSGNFAPRSRRDSFSDPEPEVDMKIFLEPAAAGPGNPLVEGAFDMIKYPVSAIPDGAEFGIRISGQSMSPRYVDSQIAWIEPSEELYNGDVGVFYYDDNAYIKKYVVEQPKADEIPDYIDEEGRVMPKVTLYSLNRECANLDVTVKPGHPFYIVGRVLN